MQNDYARLLDAAKNLATALKELAPDSLYAEAIIERFWEVVAFNEFLQSEDQKNDCKSI